MIFFTVIPNLKPLHSQRQKEQKKKLRVSQSTLHIRIWSKNQLNDWQTLLSLCRLVLGQFQRDYQWKIMWSYILV